jgi:hypothetical protein
VAELTKRFKDRHGCIYYRDLIGHNHSNPEERVKVVEKGLFTTICGACIQDSVFFHEELLEF